MNLELVEKIAKAVLYEGYLLYPYRPSSVKNRRRFNFGVLAPPACGSGEAESPDMRTECLVLGGPHTRLDIRVRFLQVIDRVVEESVESGVRPVQSLVVGGRTLHSFQEAVEREINLAYCELEDLMACQRRVTFGFPPSQEIEPVRDSSGAIAAAVRRTQHRIDGVVEVTAHALTGEGLYRLAAQVFNSTTLGDAEPVDRNELLPRSLVSTHTILTVKGGEFVSLLDPPDQFRAAASECRNVRTWPVLAGDTGDKDTMLSSPIILYDYPEIAPESPGDLFDATEIDEILTLRILTMTDEEKQEARSSDEHARRLLERTETLPEEHLAKLHGALRELRPIDPRRDPQ